MSLSPTIQAALENFGNRRRKLLRLRILLSGCGILLSGTLAITLLDWLFFLPDSLRNTLALVLYTSVAIGSWRRGARFLFHPNDPKTVARQMEAAAPSPHGHFLATVELSLNPKNGTANSLAFRSLIQTHAENHAASINPRQLLPRRHLLRELQLTLGAATLMGALFLVSGREFGVLCVRALLPTVNLPRISQFQITLIDPSPSEGTVPEDEKWPLTLEVSGPAPAIPTLEILSKTQHSSSPLRATPNGQFTAQIEVGKTPLEYRIRAGDAQTRRFFIQPVPRPHAVSFTKTYSSPAYTHAAPRKLTEEDGSLSAIQDSLVEVKIRVDQPVDSARLNMEQGGRSQSLVLEPTASADVLKCTFPIKENGSYHLELVSSQTGFSSRPTPQFEIRATPDTPPTLTLETPVQDLALALGESLRIRGHAEDDIELAYFAQGIRINQTAWSESTLLPSPSKSIELDRLWDPLLDRAKPGDLIALKLIAVDSKGQRSESRIVQIAIAATGTLSSFSKTLALQRDIQEQIQGLQTEVQEAARALVEVKVQTESRSPDVIRRDQATVSAQRALENAIQKAAAARAQLATALGGTTDAQTEKDFLRIGQLLNRIQFGSLELARQALMESNDGAALRADDKKEALRVASESATQAAHKTNLVSEGFKARLSALESLAITESARVLAEEQRALAALPPDSTAESPLNPPSPENRRQQVNEAAVRSLHQELSTLTEHAPQTKDRLNAAKVDLRKARGLLEKSLQTTSPERAQERSSASLELAASLDRTETALTSLQPALNAAADKARENLTRESQSASQRLEQLRNDLTALEHRPNLSPQSKTTQSTLRSASEAATLQADANLTSARDTPEKSLAPDLATAARALRAGVLESQPAKAAASRANELAQALRPLEGASKLEALAKTAEQLAHDLPDEEAPLSNSQKDAWKSHLKELQKLTNEAKNSGLPEPTAEQLRRLQSSEATAKIQDTLDSRPLPQTQSAQPDRDAVTQFTERLRETAETTRDSVLAARAALAQQAPTAAEEFKRLAQEAASASANTAGLQAPIPRPADLPQTNTPPSLNDAQKAEARLKQQVAAARDSLTQNANQQDSATSEGRERTRDADGANALLNDAGKASATLEKAAKTKDPASRSALLEKAREQQSRLAQQLTQIGEHLENVESGNAEKTKQSRAGLRESEKESGTAGVLAAAQKRAADLAALASASPSEAKNQLEQLTKSSKPSAQPNGQDTPPDASKSPENKSLQQALDSLKNSAPGTVSPDTRNAIASATQANQNTARSHRTQQSARDSSGTSDSGSAPEMASSGGSSGNGAPLPGLPDSTTADWGKLPKRLATDLMEGRREQTSGEYQGAIEAYFRTVAEKARQTKDPK